MDTLKITIIGVAGRTRLNNPSLVPFPGDHLVNLRVAILALDVIDEMRAGIVLGGLFFMATMAGERLNMQPGSLCEDVLIDVHDIQMATVARVCAVGRLAKFPLVDLISMTAETFGVIRALIAGFLFLDGGFFSFLRGFRSSCLCDPRRTLRLADGVGCPNRFAVQNKYSGEGNGD